MDLSVIVVSWNVAGPLSACLGSIALGSVGCTHEVLVVDNCSSDGSAEMVVERYPAVRLILNSTNVGYAAANNQGLLASSGRFVLFLNPDTVVAPEALTKQVQFLSELPEAGACAPQLLTVGGSPQPYSYGDDPTIGHLARRALVRLFGRRSIHNWDDRFVREVDWVSGACLMTRSQAVCEIGGFDTDFLAYFEDVDLCFRLRQAGWSVYRYPLTVVAHAGGQSMMQAGRASDTYHRSLEEFYAKHYSPAASRLLRLFAGPYRTLTRIGRRRNA